eukprot:XP_001698617.1 predicted protein [Chlamydomonas reinhardtii]
MASKGQVPTRDLPHPRPHCSNQRYRESQFGADVANVAHCPQCFCYVCDVKASECAFWGTGILGSDHANAHPDNTYWARLRMRARVAKPPAARQRLLTAASTSAVAPVRAALARWEQAAAVAALAKAEAEEAAGGAGVEAGVVAGGAAGPAGASSSSVVGVREPAAPPQRGAAAAAAGPALGAAAASTVTQQVALQRRAGAQHGQRLPLLPPLPQHHSQQQLHNQQQQQPQQDPAKALMMQQGLAQLPPQDRHTMQLQVQAQLMALQQQQQHLPAALGHKTEEQDPAAQLLQQEVERAPPQHRDEWQQELLAQWMAPQQPQLAAGVQREDVLAAARQCLSHLTAQQHKAMLHDAMSQLPAEQRQPKLEELRGLVGACLAHTVRARACVP